MITIEKEIWKPVRGFEEYAEISNLGQIHKFERVWYTGRGHKQKRLQEEKWTYGSENHCGYLEVRIGGVKKGVHQWVYMTFVGEITEGLEVNHIDEDKHNNCVWNLNLMTPKENTNWGTRNARIADALRGRKFSEETKTRMSTVQKNNPKKSKAIQALDPTTMEVIYEFPSAKEAQRQYGFHNSHISACCRGKLKSYKGYIWRYVDI